MNLGKKKKLTLCALETETFLASIETRKKSQEIREAALDDDSGCRETDS